MSEPTNEHKEYIDSLFADVKIAQEKAEVHKDTKVINFKPQFSEDFTEKDLGKAVEFINRQTAIVSTATSNIGYDNFKNGKAEHWRGVLDLGPLTITAESHLRETYDMGKDKKEYDYGITDICLDYRFDDGLTAFYDHFSDLDNKRCKALFEKE